jgi:hypothetical protein
LRSFDVLRCDCLLELLARRIRLLACDALLLEVCGLIAARSLGGNTLAFQLLCAEQLLALLTLHTRESRGERSGHATVESASSDTSASMHAALL